MKTSIKTLSTICAVVISLSAIAQPRSHNNNGNGKGNQNDDNKKVYASAGYSSWNPWGGGVSVQVSNYPYYAGGPHYYGNGYGNHYNIKKVARYSIRQSAQVIRQALHFSDWNDMYSPWLAKAIRHQQYAKQLYFWGDYAGALNHAERAGFLAYNTLNYFNGYYGYNGGFDGGYNYPNPYGDPNNPYYRQSNPNGSGNNVNPGNNMNSGNDDGDFGYRKSSGTTNATGENNQKTERKMQKEEIDNTLPQNKISDKELLKTNPKDLDIE